MENNDVQTVTLKRAPNGTFPKSIESDWLKYLGFTEKEIAKGILKITVTAAHASDEESDEDAPILILKKSSK